jgi:hypothetical protein
MKRTDNAGLLFRGDLGENRDPFNEIGQFAGSHLFHLRTERNAIDFETNLAANLACDDLVVAGEDLDCYARLIQRGYRGAGAIFGWVEKSDES